MAGEITLNHICKVEGHASIHLDIDKGKVTKCELEAKEGARFFEGLVLGKKVEDIQEVVSRICGICSCAHSVCAVQALENALGLVPSEQDILTRNLLLLGERIRSHATHLYFLVLPDYLGYGALTMAKNQKETINHALKIIRVGNKIVETFGGREMHPFVKIKSDLPDLEGLSNMVEELRPLMDETLKVFSNLKYPEMKRETEFLCLKDEYEYGFSSDILVSHSGKINTQDYTNHIKENIREYATSKFVLMDGSPYLTGSLVRLHINGELLDRDTKKLMKKHKVNLPMENPFYNTVAQAIELADSIEQVKRMLERVKKIGPQRHNSPDFPVRSGRGVGAVEAPRGTLFHEYEIDKEGRIAYCNIITPTAQNLTQIERDITAYVNYLLEKKTSKEKIVTEIEKIIRSFDPCFSCSTHFLKVNWNEK